MFINNGILMAMNEQPLYLLPKMAARHGLITGATGTGKTVSVKVMAEAFSDAGVPVFLSDIKGDLSGMSQPGIDSESMQERIARFGLNSCGWQFKGFPTSYWDVWAQKGMPVRATISEMGPMLLSRLMDLSDAQEGVLNIIFKIADDQGLLLLDLKDLRAVVQAVGDHASDYKTTYGNIATSTIGAIQRGLLELESQGADSFFGEPSLDINDWMRRDAEGRGYINVLNCENLFQRPDLYAAFLLWMLSELYECLPEVGDLDKPKMVFFFDEAHTLFKNKSKELLNKVEQVVRLIRSKGVGVYFITQNPADIPDSVLSQLGNKIQHALHAYTPSDQKAVRAAAQSFAVNPDLKTEEVIPQLENGEALVSFLDENGAPSMVQRAYILPPQSFMGTIDTGVITSLTAADSLYSKYAQAIDRESAYELLNGKLPQQAAGAVLGGAAIIQNGLPVQAINEQQTAPAQQLYAENTAAASSGSWFCTNCGMQNSANFCGNCGSARPMGSAASAAPQQGFVQPQAAASSIQGQSSAPSLVAAVQAEQEQAAAKAAGTVNLTQAQLEKLQKEAVKQAKAELKEEQEAEKAAKKTESDFAKSAKSIATSAGRTAVNYLVRGALGNLLKK